MAIFSVFSLVELILCKNCLRFMSDFACAKNRNAAEGKKKKRKRGFQYSSLTIGYWWEICTQLTWNKMQQFLPSWLSPQTEVCLAHCIQNICILPLVQTDVAQTYSCNTVPLQGCKLPTSVTDFPQSGNLEVCGFCGNGLLQAKVSYFLTPEGLMTGKIRFCWLLILRSWKETNPLSVHSSAAYAIVLGACCMGAWTTRQTLAKGELGLR